MIVAAALYVGFQRVRGSRYAFGSLQGCNVLLITLDTTRADHLPAYGYKGVRTPGLDTLAAKSVIFDDALAHVPATFPSHTSILTGLLPIAHGVRDNKGYTVDAKTTTLAEILHGHGYQTAAFVSAFILDARWGLAKGFDLYFDRFNPYQSVNRDDVQRRAEETEAEVERWLPSHADKTFFLWVHFYDPHKPYDPPEPFATEYASHRYDGEIAYMDRSIGRLLAMLDDRHLADRTLVIVTGDHGEGLGEHREATHGMFIYRSTLHVPLLIRLPRGTSRRVGGVVSHVDLAPTILELLGIHPPPAMQGSSLIPLINGRDGKERVAYSESLHAQLLYGWSSLTSLTTSRYQFIEAPKPELYDNVLDPGQTKNLIDVKATQADDLRSRLHDVIRTLGKSGLEGPKPLDADTEARLRALGYVGSTVTPTAASLKNDPKDKLPVAMTLEDASNAFSRKDFRGTLRLVLPITRSDPELVEAHYLAGAALAYVGSYDAAIDELARALAERPDHRMALATLGLAYEGKGNLKEAEAWYRKVLAYEPDHGSTLLRLARLCRATNRAAEADAYFAKAVAPLDAVLKTATEPGARATLLANRASLFQEAGRPVDAETDLHAAIALAPNAPSLHLRLARLYESAHDVPHAIENYQEETRIAPTSFDAQMGLGMLFLGLRQYGDAIPCFQAMQRIAPDDARPGLFLAECYLRSGQRLGEARDLARASLAKVGETPEIQDLIGRIEQKLGHAKEASEAFARSQALRSGS